MSHWPCMKSCLLTDGLSDLGQRCLILRHALVSSVDGYGRFVLLTVKTINFGWLYLVRCAVDRNEIMNSLTPLNIFSHQVHVIHMPWFVGKCSYFDGNINNGSFKCYCLCNDHCKYIYCVKSVLTRNASCRTRCTIPCLQNILLLYAFFKLEEQPDSVIKVLTLSCNQESMAVVSGRTSGQIIKQERAWHFSVISSCRVIGLALRFWDC